MKKKFVIELSDENHEFDIGGGLFTVYQFTSDRLMPLEDEEQPTTTTEIADANFIQKYSVDFLLRCANLQLKKSQDYQNPNSSVVQSDYYPSGIKTIDEIIHAKKLRLRSLIETAEHLEDAQPNFESLEDTLMDMVNYCSFMAAYINYKIDGQSDDRDLFNRKEIE